MSKSIQSYTIAYGQEAQQFAELSLPAGSGPFPVIILLHGGFWRTPYDLTLMRGLAQDLTKRGWAAWNIEYRRVGDEGGGWSGTFQDVGRAADYLTTLISTYPLDLSRVIALGHSAGGHLALWLAARHRLPVSEITVSPSPLPLTGVISLAGANDLEHVWRLRLGNNAVVDLLSGNPEEYPERYRLASPAAQLPLGIPQLLIHGDADDRVPLVVSQEYAARAAQAGDRVKLLNLPGVNHFVLIDPASHPWQITIAEITSLLRL